jgi:hypothetical protein
LYAPRASAAAPRWRRPTAGWCCPRTPRPARGRRARRRRCAQVNLSARSAPRAGRRRRRDTRRSKKPPPAAARRARRLFRQPSPSPSAPVVRRARRSPARAARAGAGKAWASQWASALRAQVLQASAQSAPATPRAGLPTADWALLWPAQRPVVPPAAGTSPSTGAPRVQLLAQSLAPAPAHSWPAPAPADTASARSPGHAVPPDKQRPASGRAPWRYPAALPRPCPGAQAAGRRADATAAAQAAPPTTPSSSDSRPASRSARPAPAARPPNCPTAPRALGAGVDSAGSLAAARLAQSRTRPTPRAPRHRNTSPASRPAGVRRRSGRRWGRRQLGGGCRWAALGVTGSQGRACAQGRRVGRGRAAARAGHLRPGRARAGGRRPGRSGPGGVAPWWPARRPGRGPG